MNGGLLDAVDRLSESELDAAEEGFRWLDLDAAALVVDYVRNEIRDGANDDEDRAERLELEADDRYSAVIPTDSMLVAAFRPRLAAEPEVAGRPYIGRAALVMTVAFSASALRPPWSTRGRPA
jgi:hypothetical protein